MAALSPLGNAWPLEAVAGALGFSLDAAARTALIGWLDLLVVWNARMDLTAARSADELVDIMVADALLLATRAPANASVVDVGTGAGAPGLGLALVRPDLRVTASEPVTKRVAFMRTVVGTVARDVTLTRERGEVIAARAPGSFDVAVARATLPPQAWLALGAKLVRRGGSAWVLLAKEPAPEAPGMRLVEDVAYTWPLSGAARRAVRYERE